MDVQIEQKGDIVVLRVEGRLDAASSPQLEDKLNSIIAAGYFKILLNLTNVDYLSSAGMRLLLSISKKLKHLEGKIVACGLNNEVLEVIKMAGFQQVLQLYPNEEDALNKL
jgi:anti-sigma B factor antagonist/stage II sporulation protein AA (anti-sigma F factor antagonist)